MRPPPKRTGAVQIAREGNAAIYEQRWTVLDKETAFRKLREIISASQKESANPVKKSPIQNTKRCSETKELCGGVKRRRDG